MDYTGNLLLGTTTGTALLEINGASVQNTNKCIIRTFKTNNASKIIIISLIDNLLKGAAGQAIQCFNIMNNLEEHLGLI